jgi:hypothetical protein
MTNTTTDMTGTLARSSVRLDASARGILSQGRTVRSRNRDGEYAIVMADRLSEELNDGRADYVISITAEVFERMAGDQFAMASATVADRHGAHLGEIRVKGWSEGERGTEMGRVSTVLVPFSDLREGDLFSESESDDEGRAVVFRVTADADADANGKVHATVAGGDERVFDLGADYLAFKVVQS